MLKIYIYVCVFLVVTKYNGPYSQKMFKSYLILITVYDPAYVLNSILEACLSLKVYKMS